MAIDAIALNDKETQPIKGEIAPLMQRVMSAIKSASKATGVDFAYLMNKAAQESGFKTNAKAVSSSATGLYQFTEQTWLRMIKEYGGKHDLGLLSDQITLRADGSATVKDRSVRQQILNLRNNPEISSFMAAQLAQENKTYLETHVGGAIGNTELYLAHFLGAQGAARFIINARSNPQTQAASLLPDAAAANKSVFFDGEGKPRTVAQIYDRFAAKMDGKGVDLPDDAPMTALADVSNILSNLPGLRLPASDMPGLPPIMPKDARDSGPNLTYGVSPESLYSVMLMAQLDKLNFNETKSQSEQQNSKEQSGHYEWPAAFA